MSAAASSFLPPAPGDMSAADRYTYAPPDGRPIRNEECPHCGRTRDGCARYPSGWWLCPRTDSGRWCENGGGWLHPPDSAAAPPPPVPLLPAAPRQTADPALLDRVWRAALAALPLSDRHRDDLRGKGMTEDQIARHGCGSVDGSWSVRRRAGDAAQAAAGETPLVGMVAGFARDPLGNAVLASPRDRSCRVIPYTDAEGRIVGARLRLDGATTGKYQWASAGEGGATIDGNTVYVARPARLKPGRAGFAVVTEGEDKARALADWFGAPALSVPGITNTARAGEALTALGDIRTVVVAFDQEGDPDKAARVAQAEGVLARRLREARPGLTVLQLQWEPEDGKGADDAIRAGGALIAMPHPATDDASTLPDPAELAQVRRERDDAREHNRTGAAILGNKCLGGDTGPIVGFFVYNNLKAQISNNPAPDGRYVISPNAIAGGELNERGNIAGGRVSTGTVTGKLDLWAESGLLDIEVSKEPVILRGGRADEKHVYTITVPGNDLRPIARALTEGVAKERSRRGGDTRRCPGCGGTTFVRQVRHTCTTCGLIDEGTPARVDYGDHADAERPQTLHAGDEGGRPAVPPPSKDDRPQTLRPSDGPADPGETPPPRLTVLYPQSLRPLALDPAEPERPQSLQTLEPPWLDDPPDWDDEAAAAAFDPIPF